ncbi:hypothetical protein GYMLUDRAFT_50593 [Collybiopsis luxurians FD-317 M1]|uniref:Ras-domain-containing protein n=1 Tax=Collybiopsis luxurians FD-317 M1 TaxID=944289 RepID=A0A0D0C0Y9_9AGAR|nr:hypothetical protein GYMLUDRAFT_50593 [Collybiopsis luxurians FD-317 M1]
MAGGITWHYVFKFIITGDAAVGKSSLLVRLTDQRFLANPDPTLGVEFGSKLITIPEEDDGEGSKVVKLQCWDTAGTESFRSITRSYYRGAAGCLLVYDVTSRRSFENTRTWLADVRQHADPHLTCILVGNKVDLCEEDSSESSESAAAAKDSTGHSRSSSSQSAKKRKRQVPTAEAGLFAKEEGLLFVESSAKSGLNVEAAFEQAARDILGKVRRGVFDGDDIRSPGVKLSRSANSPQTNGNSSLDGSKNRSGCCNS